MFPLRPASLWLGGSQVRAPQGNFKMTSKGAMKTHPKANELRFVTKNDGYVHVHPSSVNYTVRNDARGEAGAKPARPVTRGLCRRFATTAARIWFTTRR